MIRFMNECRLSIGLTMLLIAAACSSSTPSTEPEVRERGRNAVRYDSRTLDAFVSTSWANRHLGDPWLLLDTALVANRGVIQLERTEISVKTPSGVRIPMISNDEFRASLNEFRSGVRFADSAPVDRWDDRATTPVCDRWFYANPNRMGIAYDTVYLRPLQECFGPLVFMVPGGVQPGRWVLMIELEEESVRIPFTLEYPDSR
jgi:hypothetical protein